MVTRFPFLRDFGANFGPTIVARGTTHKCQWRLTIVLRTLPAVGATVSKDASYGEVESVKAVSDLIAPLSGEVLEVNQAVVDAPETVNDDPYGNGWLIRVRLSDPGEVDGLLDLAGYRQGLAEQ